MTKFGDAADLYISNDCDINTSSYSSLGSAYQLPNGYTKDSE